MDLLANPQINAQWIVSIITFYIVGGFTPGPNNMMLMTSGVRFGYARTLPHIIGINIGFTFMSVVVAYGLAQIFIELPWVHLAIKIAGSGYLLWLAWRIYSAAAPENETSAEARAQPFSFIEAALFQWVNPKAWQIAATAAAMFVHPQSASYHVEIATLALIIMCLSFPTASAWTLGGVAMRRVLKAPQHVVVFNRTMAALLVVSMVLSWV